MLGKMEMRAPPGSRPRDGRHCDLCGCSQPAVKCDKCGSQIFCLSCDDMYHRHPKRRFHLRKAVDTIPAVPQARPVLPMKVSHLNATNPGDPSKMPLPPPRKKKTSLFGSFRKSSPSGENSPPLPKKEYSWTDRLGGIKKFMSNRPLPPLPNTDENDRQLSNTSNGDHSSHGDMTFIHKRVDERPPQLPSRSSRAQDTSNIVDDTNVRHFPVNAMGQNLQMRNGATESGVNQNQAFSGNLNIWPNRLPNQNGHQAFSTMSRPNQSGFMAPGLHGYPIGMQQSASATDLQNIHNVEHIPGSGLPHPHYPQQYPMNPHMPPHYPYPMYPQFPNYPQYFGNSMGNLSNPPSTDGELSESSEAPSRHSSKKHSFRKRAKRSQSVMMDRMAYPGQFFPFGPYPGYGTPWGPPMPLETPPSPASSVRSLNKIGRSRRRKKATSEEDEEFSPLSSSPLSRPKSSSSDKPAERSEISRHAPLAKMSSSSEEEMESNSQRRNKMNTIQTRISDPLQTPSSPASSRKRPPKLKKRNSSKQSDSEPQDVTQMQTDRRSSKESNTEEAIQHQSPAQITQSPTAQSPSLPSNMWECVHCTFINPAGNRICQVCCKTFDSSAETPATTSSRPASAAENRKKQSFEIDQDIASPDRMQAQEERTAKKEKQDMAILNSALDEAEKEINRGLEELMKLKDDIDNDETANKRPTHSKTESSETSKPVYKSTGRMRTSILEKLAINKPQTSKQTKSTEIQTGQEYQTSDKIIEARRFSNSSESDAYNSPLAQSPELGNGFSNSKTKKDSSCQTLQQDSLSDYLERKKTAEEAFIGRPVNNFGFGYGDRIDMVTSPVPMMYDRFLGGGLGIMQRSHSRASLFTGRLNDVGPMEYGGQGFGYGAAPMYRSMSRGSLTGDYPDARMSDFHNLRKADYYLSMEELVERRRQETMRAQGLELVRMIREAEQQGFTADDIQVALTHCGNRSPMEWLQDNWRNMLDSVITLSTNYGNDKTENDIGVISECEARDALRMHKGNVWAAVTECVEDRQKKYLELSGRGKFARKDILEALTHSDGDVEMAYAKLSKITGKPFLMRIWGSGEGVQNQDGAQPVPEDMRDAMYEEDIIPHRYQKNEFGSDALSDDLWSEGAADWEEDFEDEREELENLQTCIEDLSPDNPQEMMTPESDRSDYMDALALDDRNVSSPSDDVFYVIPDVKKEKKRETGFLRKLAALRKDSIENIEDKEEDQLLELNNAVNLETDAFKDQIKNNGKLTALKQKLSAIKDTVTGFTKPDNKLPCSQPERRTIIVRGQLAHESLTDVSKNVTPTSVKLLEEDLTNQNQKCVTIDKSNDDRVEKTETKDLKSKTIDTGQIDFKIATEVKRSQSLAEKLKQAKQKYSSRTNLNSVQDQTDVTLPSTSKQCDILSPDKIISLNNDKNNSMSELSTQSSDEINSKNIKANNQSETRDVVQNTHHTSHITTEKNFSDNKTKNKKNVEHFTDYSNKPPKDKNNIEFSIKSLENVPVEIKQSENNDQSFENDKLLDKNTKDLSCENDTTKSCTTVLTSNNLLTSSEQTEADLLHKISPSCSLSALKISDGDKEDKDGCIKQIFEISDYNNGVILDQINDSLKAAINKKEKNVSSGAILMEDAFIEKPSKLTVNSETDKSFEIVATKAIALDNVSQADSLNTAESMNLTNENYLPPPQHSEKQNIVPKDTKSAQIVDDSPEKSYIENKNSQSVEEKLTLNSNDQVLSSTSTACQDETLNSQTPLQIDSPNMTPVLETDISEINSDFQNKSSGSDKNIALNSEFITHQNEDPVKSATVEDCSQSTQLSEISDKAQSSAPTAAETIKSKKLSKMGKVKKIKSTENSKLKNLSKTNLSDKADAKDKKSSDTGLDVTTVTTNNPNSASNGDALENKSVATKTDIKEYKNIHIDKITPNEVNKSKGKNAVEIEQVQENTILQIVDVKESNEIKPSNSLQIESLISGDIPINNGESNSVAINLNVASVSEAHTTIPFETNEEIEKEHTLPKPVELSMNIVSPEMHIDAKKQINLGTSNMFDTNTNSATSSSTNLADAKIANCSTNLDAPSSNSSNTVYAEAEDTPSSKSDLTRSEIGEAKSTALETVHSTMSSPLNNTEVLENIQSESQLTPSISHLSDLTKNIAINTAAEAVSSTISEASNTTEVEIDVQPKSEIPKTNSNMFEAPNITEVETDVQSKSEIPKTDSNMSEATNTTEVETSILSKSEITKTDSNNENSPMLVSDARVQHSFIQMSTAGALTHDNKASTNQFEHSGISKIKEDNFQNVDNEELTDSQSDDDSRPSSVTPPSPVDALRNRFEGLAGGLRGPVRPQSPFRRMSFNSRKQVIALERKRDSSADKPWFHQKTVEPAKTVIPKRTIRQQLEMERKVRKMVSDRKCRTYRKAEIVVQLMDMNFEEEEALLAANECSTLEQAISYLQQECLLCAGHFPVSMIVSMTHCEHRACRECIRAYFTVQIRDRTILDLLCPFCNQPDIVSDEDIAQDYFNHLDIMLKKLVDYEIHELFQRKLRDRVLMKDPNFRWCSQCSSGFISMPNLKRLVCPDCNAVTCASCRRLWERDHQGISCEAFAALKDASDPEAQAAGLAKLLTEDGIDCPRCHFRYALAKGGCMHFRCIQCQHDFCSGCSKPFKMGQKCGVSEFCVKLGLHAHHPRNCLFYLRDKEPQDLQKLLEMNNVKYNKDPPDGMEVKSVCQVMEQKETVDGMLDDICGKDVQDGYAGLCRVHYVEYLGQLVNKNQVDPIQIFDNDDLELVLRRASIRLPAKKYRENDDQYKERLIKLIQDELPLDKMDGS